MFIAIRFILSRSQPSSSVTFRSSSAKFETTSSSYTDNTNFSEPPPLVSNRSLPINRFYSQTHGNQSFLIGNHSFSSQAGTESSGEEDDAQNNSFSFNDISDSGLISEADKSESESESEDDDIAVKEPQNELNLSDNEEEEEAVETKGEERRGPSGLFKVMVNSSSMVAAKKALDKWVEDGNDLSRSEISGAMFELRRRRMFGKALQVF